MAILHSFAVTGPISRLPLLRRGRHTLPHGPQLRGHWAIQLAHTPSGAVKDMIEKRIVAYPVRLRNPTHRNLIFVFLSLLYVFATMGFRTRSRR